MSSDEIIWLRKREKLLVAYVKKLSKMIPCTCYHPDRYKNKHSTDCQQHIKNRILQDVKAMTE